MPEAHDPDYACRGRCEFHGQLYCKFNDRPCSEYAEYLDGDRADDGS